MSSSSLAGGSGHDDTNKLGLAARLPAEIVFRILESFQPGTWHAQSFFHTCVLLSRGWCILTIPYLYEYPRISGANFTQFVRTLVPSKNLRIRECPYAKFVKVLDLRSLVHESSPRLTARLLNRTSLALTTFHAPQFSFGINSFPALKKCTKLVTLDLSYVSLSQPLQDMLEVISRLRALESLHLPRSSGFTSDDNKKSWKWPPRLSEIVFAGHVDKKFTLGLVELPRDLQALTVQQCPRLTTGTMHRMLLCPIQRLKGLRRLKLYDIPNLRDNCLDEVFSICPGVRDLSVPTKYVSYKLWEPTEDHETDPTQPAAGHCLQKLELTNAELIDALKDPLKLIPQHFLDATDKGCLPSLRRICVAAPLEWGSSELFKSTDRLSCRLENLTVKDLEEHARKCGTIAPYLSRVAEYADFAAMNHPLTHISVEEAGVHILDTPQ